MDHTRARLLAEGERARDRLADLTADFAAMVASSQDTNADDEHDPEGATIAFERSQLDALVRSTRRQLDDLAAAVARYDAGTYGVCEGCGTAIDARRLEARPTATSCLRCAASAGRATGR